MVANPFPVLVPPPKVTVAGVTFRVQGTVCSVLMLINPSPASATPEGERYAGFCC